VVEGLGIHQTVLCSLREAAQKDILEVVRDVRSVLCRRQYRVAGVGHDELRDVRASERWVPREQEIADRSQRVQIAPGVSVETSGRLLGCHVEWSAPDRALAA
jgi:hypothetical protein